MEEADSKLKTYDGMYIENLKSTVALSTLTDICRLVTARQVDSCKELKTTCGSIGNYSEFLVPEEHLVQSEVIWDYMLLHHKLEKSDVILVLGNHDVRTAEYAANLWFQGFAEWLVLSGNVGSMTKGKWTRSEAEEFRDIVVQMGVPDNRIILEREATNTGENVKYSYEVMRQRGLNPKKIILIQMPYMERRTYATFMKQWPGDITTLQVSVSSPPIEFRHYPNSKVGTFRYLIAALLGMLERIRTYPRKGWQITQVIPNNVMSAFWNLVNTERYSDFLV
ncbi:uncharacterized protein SCO4629-like [Tachypleus tridentatus]|uniref:uncharacterized protein SCO4629-like n=1 Tax=Tachypleus tridentatus TaxID=6853 RepID=UPI003FD15FC9